MTDGNYRYNIDRLIKWEENKLQNAGGEKKKGWQCEQQKLFFEIVYSVVLTGDGQCM